MNHNLYEIRYKLAHYGAEKGLTIITLEEKSNLDRFSNVSEEDVKRLHNVSYPWFWKEILVRVE